MSGIAAHEIGIMHYPGAGGLYSGPGKMRRQAADIEQAARSLGRRVRILKAGSERDIDAAFTGIVQDRLGALFVAASAFFATRRSQIVTLATHFAIPAFYPRREFAEAGGLLSYGIPISTRPTASKGFTSGAFSKARSPPICRWCSRPSSSW